ncbi:MAG: FKBP-type peptidyl-prolyl cis-trans isomerase [Bacteroidia bacterium]|jgi:FKBP-type peptidyl-prolyl cis-trans isomerase
MHRTSTTLLICAALLLPGVLGCSDSGPSTEQITLAKTPSKAWTDPVLESFDKTSGEYTMRVEIFEMGTGEVVEAGDRVSVHYQGWMPNRPYFFDDSFSRGKPHSFSLGQKNVIPGWDLGIEGMAVGTRARFHVPYGLAYGEAGRPPEIPAKSDLIFDVQLVSFL